MNIFIFLRIAPLVLAMFLALIYLLPIIFLPRLRKTNNIFTVNFCLAILCCCAYWLSLFVMLEYYTEVLFNVRMCILMNYLQMLSTIQIPFGLIAISSNRLCFIVYPRRVIFTKKKSVIIGISIQWISGIIVSLPRISVNIDVSNSPESLC